MSWMDGDIVHDINTCKAVQNASLWKGAMHIYKLALPSVLHIVHLHCADAVKCKSIYNMYYLYVCKSREIGEFPNFILKIEVALWLDPHCR